MSASPPRQEQSVVSETIPQSTFHSLHSRMSFDTVSGMEDGKKKMLTAKISVALLDELGRIPTREEIERYARAAHVLYKAVLGLHFERKHQKKNGQLPLKKKQHKEHRK